MDSGMSFRKSLFCFVFLSSIFIFNNRAWGVCLEVDEDEEECVVTSSRGDLTDGSLIQCLTDSRCQKITFGVDHVDPLISIVEVAGGVELDGRIPGGGRITLTYDEDYDWSTSTGGGTCPPGGVDHTTCLLRIMPLTSASATTGAIVSNLIIENENGAGVCLLSCDGDYTNSNRISNVTVHAGGTGLGIDLGSSNNNVLENVTLLGLTSANTSGIYIQGDRNQVTGGRIDRFQNGVTITSTGSANTVSQIDYLRIRSRPINYSNGRSVRPSEVLKAFITSSEFSVTGIVHSSTSNLEVYKFEETGDGNNYLYASTLPSSAIRQRDNSGRSQLRVNNLRFVSPISEGQSDLDAQDSVAIVGKVRTSAISGTRTTEFSDDASGDDAISGHPRCNQTSWFWKSYDYARMPGGTDPAWHVDFDQDGLANGSCSTCGHPADRSEDLDRDCFPDSSESLPDDWRSQYDFDCDGRADHRFIGFSGEDNCARPLRADRTTDYDIDSAADRLTAICRNVTDPANSARFGTWNPDQFDSDGDGLGDVCETDPDNDGLVTGLDNCPTVYNPNQRNSDERENRALIPPVLGRGDACEQIGGGVPPAGSRASDADGDGRTNLLDNCPFDPNPDQTDTDSDRVGDVCDFDDDDDGLADFEEDFNNDGVVDVGETNSKNPDTDFDTICDGPGWGFNRISCIRPLDNCPRVNNREQIDRDEDGIGDLCDAGLSQALGNFDSDGDDVADGVDNCPTHQNPSQADDNDLDTLGDPCDADDDNDGLDDATESGIFDPRRKNLITNYRPNFQRNDLDGDGFVDGVDVCPNHPFACENLENPDNPDCLGVIDNPAGDRNILPESRCGSYPLGDIDNDGRTNTEDNCVFIPNPRQLDLDADGKGNACDLDDDNDDNSNPLTDECRDYLKGLVDPLLGVSPALITARNTCVGCDSDLPARRHCDFDESANLRLHPWDPNSDHEDGHIFSHADQKCDGGGRGFGFANAVTRCEPADPCPEFFNSCVAGLVAPSISLPDFDFDLVPDENDNCSNNANPDQSDMDRNGVGDLCDGDRDGDGVANDIDNCPDLLNADQTDTDGDAVLGLGLGNACDPNPFTKNVAAVQGTGVTLGGCGSLVGADPQSKLLPTSLKDVMLFPWIWLLGLFLIILKVKGTPRSTP